jgi:hypothetical protein
MKVGDYVLATKYNDGDPCDQWAVGFYDGKLAGSHDRHMVKDSNGFHLRANGFRRCEKISHDLGVWLLRVVPTMERGCPPGVNIWNMIQDCAKFEEDEG